MAEYVENTVAAAVGMQLATNWIRDVVALPPSISLPAGMVAGINIAVSIALAASMPQDLFLALVVSSFKQLAYNKTAKECQEAVNKITEKAFLEGLSKEE